MNTGASLRLAPPAPWKKSHKLGTDASQTRRTVTGIVDREGGGTRSPTLGGGYRVTARAGAAGRDAPS